MIRKTYGVSGLTDWTTQLKVGKAMLNVHFSGGALTAYGVTPAKYSTANPFFQTVIENSDFFKSGRIKLLDTMEVEDDAAEKARKARSSGRIAAMPAMEGPCSVPDAVPPGAVPPVPEAAGPTGEAETETGGPADEAEGEAAGNVIKVADKPDAIEYLKENFPDKGYTSVKLRTKTAFEAACKECGVEFVFA